MSVNEHYPERVQDGAPDTMQELAEKEDIQVARQVTFFVHRVTEIGSIHYKNNKTGEIQQCPA